MLKIFRGGFRVHSLWSGLGLGVQSGSGSSVLGLDLDAEVQDLASAVGFMLWK